MTNEQEAIQELIKAIGAVVAAMKSNNQTFHLDRAQRNLDKAWKLTGGK